MFPGCGKSEAATRGLRVGEMALPSPHYLEGLHFQLANSLAITSEEHQRANL
ncbi:hypothetical protein HMPREF9080_02921 [Cardiobacterium valvarum F0432]|uniref:Uncharacterized protein n=1 Tax=Cardiobacterium valvarum F0432 TaxID=797473 RepID=G9ZJF2_9GAMM|nr:hypothetical protein HMPREF9080_02921 [Cardiobacterium valvarum F0432]